MTKAEFDRILESEKSGYAEDRAKELYQQAQSLEDSDPLKAPGTYNAASVAFPDTLWGKKAGDRFKSFYEQSRRPRRSRPITRPGHRGRGGSVSEEVRLP
jgi:hypothetical protein